MNLLYFVRLILKNVWLILGIAFGMAILVYLVTGNQPKTYTSTTVIFTGIATGIDLESGENRRYDFYATNAQFDNLINIIKSREIQEETGIRLMAQHLMLSRPEKEICGEDAWNALMKEVPAEVRNLVSTADNPQAGQFVSAAREALQQSASPSDTSVLDRDSILVTRTDTVMEEVTDTIRIEKYRESPKYYTVKAGDYPSSIASRHGLSLEQLERMNPGKMDPVVGGQRLRVGVSRQSYFVDSVVMRQVPVERKVEVMEPAPQDSSQPEQDYSRRMDSLTAVFDVTVARILQDQDPYERTVANLIRYKEKDQNNYIYKTLQSSNPYYSVQKINSVKVTRIQSSDLLRLSFDSNDPAVCMNTLKILTEVFTRFHQKLTASQTSLVSEYFRKMVDSARIHLDSLENQLLRFNSQNRIINYSEQTKFIAEQKELLDRDWSESFGKLSAGKAALQVIEENLDAKSRQLVQNAQILERRKKLHEITAVIAEEEIKGELTPDDLGLLKAEAERIKESLRQSINVGYQNERTTEGVKIQDILTSWFQKVIEVEESRARYETLSKRKEDFLAKYDQFAPLGSQMRKMEREIDLAQQDYMNHLHNLNLSLMKQKNVQTSNVNIVDEPIYPIKPNPGKRLFTVIAAFLAGIVLVAAIIILLEFLDNTIKLPERLAELSGKPILGAFPKLPEKPDPRIDFNLIASRAIDQLGKKIRLEELKQRNRGDQPFVMVIASTREQEGKTFIASRIVEKLRAGGSRVLYLKPQESRSSLEKQSQFSRFGALTDAWDFEYDIPDNFIGIRNVNELLRNFTFLTRGYQFILIELPALLHHEFPAALVQSGHLSLLVGKASRTWNRADDEVLRLYSSTTNHPLFSFLNGCHYDHMESIIGEIPKRRSYVRRIVKKLINIDFRLAGT